MVFFRVENSRDLPHGAANGCVLVGTGQHNKGMRLQLLHDQPAGLGGPLEGDFILLDAGENKHTAALLPLVGQVTNAALVVGAIRQRHPGCVSVVNGHSLAIEGEQPAPFTRRSRRAAEARYGE